MQLHLSKFIHSTAGRQFMSILLGFGLATLFRAVCVGDECVVRIAPDFGELTKKTRRFNGRCYRYSAEQVSFDPNRVSVSISSASKI